MGTTRTASGMVLAMVFLLGGAKESARANTVMVCVKIAALVLRPATLGMSGFLDILTDSRVLAALRLSFGAAFVAVHSHWTVMRDPAGGTYCLTARDPETGALR